MKKSGNYICSESEYLHALEQIEANLSCLSVEEAERDMENFFRIKPVRLKWYIVKAQLMLKEGKKIKEVGDFLRDKCDAWYEYDSVVEYFVFMANLAECQEDMLEGKRYLYQMHRMQAQENDDYIIKQNEEYMKCITDALKEENLTECVLQRMMEQSYIRGDIYRFILWNVLLQRENEQFDPHCDWIMEQHNARYYYERLTEKKKNIFVVIEGDIKENLEVEITAKALLLLQKEVYIVKLPQKCKFEKLEYELAENSIRNTEKTENRKIKYIPSYEIEVSGKIENNVGDILRCLAEKKAEAGLLTVLGNGYLIDQLSMHLSLKPEMERITEARTDYMDYNLAVGRYGNYLAYIANIYHTTRANIEKKLYQEPKYDFSIIIPCRNNGDTLYYTLQTCLNQTYSGSYEIVISDNTDSSYGIDTPCANICHRFNDKRIHYFRTPGNLSLPKNFEYAFLQSKGRFLLSMGADDGILSWGLEKMAIALQALPDQKILLWKEATYKWPTAESGFWDGLGNAYVYSSVTSKYQKMVAEQYLTSEILHKSFNEYGMMYYLPQLYHNSGIRREYLKEMYQKTGVLWNGNSQDICMAITIGYLEKKLYMLNELLTITGISNYSIGANFRTRNTSVNQPDFSLKYASTYTQGFRAQNYVERFVPMKKSEGDLSGMYRCMMYAYAIGVISEEQFNSFDWKNIYKNMVNEKKKDDIWYDEDMQRMRYTASLFGNDFLKWFDENLYDMLPEIFENLEVKKENNNYAVMGDKKSVLGKDCIENVAQAAEYIEEYLKDKY